jgi:hypothetical protein
MINRTIIVNLISSDKYFLMHLFADSCVCLVITVRKAKTVVGWCQQILMAVIEHE